VVHTKPSKVKLGEFNSALTACANGQAAFSKQSAAMGRSIAYVHKYFISIVPSWKGGQSYATTIAQGRQHQKAVPCDRM
jgi:hypothetical protein